MGLDLTDLALELANFGLDMPDLFAGGPGAELFQFGFQLFQFCCHVGNVHAHLLHLCAELLLPLAQRFLLLAEFFLSLAELLLRSPELIGTVNGGLVANDVGLFVALKPDKIAGNIFPESLDMVSIFGRARHDEGIGLARDDDETLFIVESVVIGKAAMRGRCWRRRNSLGDRTNGQCWSYGSHGRGAGNPADNAN